MKEYDKNNPMPHYLLFGSIMALVVLPKLLMVLMMLGAGKALSARQSSFAFYVSCSIGAALFYGALSVSKQPLKAAKDVLFGALSLLAVRLLLSYAHNLVSSGTAGNPGKSYLVSEIVLLALEALCFAYLFFVWVMAIRDGEDSLGAGKLFLHAFQGIGEILLGALIYGVFSLCGGFLSDIFISGLGKSQTVTAFIVKLTLFATVVFAASCPVIGLMQKKADRVLAKAAGNKKQEVPEGNKKQEVPEEAKEPEKGAEGSASAMGKKPFSIPTLISIGVLLLTVILLDILPHFFVESRSGAILGSLDAGMAESFAYAEKRDYLMALKSVDKAKALPGAWKAYLDGNPAAAREAYELDRDTPMVELLYYYTCAENPSRAKKAGLSAQNVTRALSAHEGDEVWYFGYLDILSKMDSLTDAEKQEKKRVIMELAARNRFNCGAILPSELTDSERDEILENIGDYESIADRYADRIGVWEILNLYVERDGVDAEVAQRVTELAREYPASEEVRELVYMILVECLKDYKSRSFLYDWSFANNTMLGLIDAANEDKDSFAMSELTIRAAQHFILYYRSNYAGSDARKDNVREKTYPIILNFDRLFESELNRDDGLTADEKVEARIIHTLDMAQVMMDMEMPRELQEYLENALKSVSDERIENILGAAALTNGDYDTALPILEKEYEADKNDLELTMELAILYYRSGDVTKSLEKAVSFTEGMLSPGVLEDKPQLGTDFTALIATYITGDKSVADKAGGKHCPYKDFTEEQMEIIRRSALLNKMLDCEYRYQYDMSNYMSSNKVDEYRVLEEDAFAFTQEYLFLSTGYYLAGRICGHYVTEFRADETGQKAQEELIDLDKAIEMYKKCLSFEDNQPAVWYSLALTLDHEERYEEALEACNRAIDHAYYDSWYSRFGNDYHGWGIREHAEIIANLLRRKLENNR